MNNDNYLILFGDLIGSTEVASEASPSVYSNLYIGSFHFAAKCAKRYLELPLFSHIPHKKRIKEIRLAGDEVLSFTKIPENLIDGVSDLVSSAIAFAFVLKLCWLASPYNLKRLYEKKFPRDIAIGIHIGPAVPIGRARHADIAGLHINVAKRLETAGRSGRQSRIFASDDVAHYFSKWLARYANTPLQSAPPLLYTRLADLHVGLDLKGIPVKVSPHELQMNETTLTDFLQLLELTHQSPRDPNAHSEKAVKAVAKLLLDGIFRNSQLLEHFEHAKNPRQYIDLWFNATNDVSKVYFNDLWTLLSAFFISCGFGRYSGLTDKKRNKYERISRSLHCRIVELTNPQ